MFLRVFLPPVILVEDSAPKNKILDIFTTSECKVEIRLDHILEKLIRSNYVNGNMNGVVQHGNLIPKVLIISTIIFFAAIVAVNRM